MVNRLAGWVRSLRGVLLGGVGLSLAVQVIGEQGELMHDACLFSGGDRLGLSPTVASSPGGHHT
jgi:hypothetical protein